MSEQHEWAVDWDSITTPGTLLLWEITQLTPQALNARDAVQHLIAGKVDRMQSVPSVLAAIGSLASFLWPNPGRDLGGRFPKRGGDLRHILGIDDDRPEYLRKAIRNDLIHVDERLEEFYNEDPKMSFSMWMEGKPEGDQRALFAWDAVESTLYSQGVAIDMKALLNWLQMLLSHIRAKGGELLFLSDEIGQE
jgi:hypothetical protein